MEKEEEEEEGETLRREQWLLRQVLPGLLGFHLLSLVKGDGAHVYRVIPFGMREQPVNRYAAAHPACQKYDS